MTPLLAQVCHITVMLIVQWISHYYLLFWPHPGSLLVACAHFGGYVLGSDIDMILVHGRGRQA